MDSINQEEHKQDLQKESPMWPIGFLIAIIIGEVVLFYNYLNISYKADDFTTLRMNIGLAPTYVNAKNAWRYEITGKEYNCWFWIKEDALLMIEDNEKLVSKIKAIKRGDTVMITIYSKDTVKLVSIYHKMSVLGLSTLNETIFTPDQVTTYTKSRQKNFLIFGGFLILIFLILSIRSLLSNR